MAEVPRYSPDADRPKKPEDLDDDEEAETDSDGLPVRKSSTFIEALRARWRESNATKEDKTSEAAEEAESLDDTDITVDWLPTDDSAQFPEAAAPIANTPVNAETLVNSEMPAYAEGTEEDAAAPADELPAVAGYEAVESEPPEDEETPPVPPQPPQPALGSPTPHALSPNGPFNPNIAAAATFDPNLTPNAAQQFPSAETTQVVEHHTVEQSRDGLPYVLIGAEWMGRHRADKKEAKARQAGDAQLAERQRQATERLQADLHAQSKTSETNATQLKELLQRNQVQAAELQAKRQGSEARPMAPAEHLERHTTPASRPEASKVAAATPEQAPPQPSKLETKSTAETDLTHEARVFVATELAPKIEAQTPHELDYELRQEIKDASADDIAAAHAAQLANLEAVRRQKEAMLQAEALLLAQSTPGSAGKAAQPATSSQQTMYRKAVLGGLAAAGIILALALLAYWYASLH